MVNVLAAVLVLAGNVGAEERTCHMPLPKAAIEAGMHQLCFTGDVHQWSAYLPGFWQCDDACVLYRDGVMIESGSTGTTIRWND